MTAADPTFSTTWVARAWVESVVAAASPEALAEGLEYARLGQTRRISVERAVVQGSVQGRSPTAYLTTIRFQEIRPEVWEQASIALAAQAKFSARLLAGDLPVEVGDLFEKLGGAVIPNARVHATTTCSCARVASSMTAGVTKPPTDGGWCKHAVCLAYILAERMTVDPLIAFTLRGKAAPELLEAVRHQRTELGSGEGASAVYTPAVPGVSDAPVRPLEGMGDQFWECPEDPDELEFEPARAEVSHAILRRLGPSPFTGSEGVKGGGARFPLVGLLATCYDIVAEAALREGDGPRPLTEGQANLQ